MRYTYVIIGGGIAGVSCVEGLSFLDPESDICLITESGLVKSVTKLVPVTKLLHDMTVKECDLNNLSTKCTVIIDSVISIDPRTRVLHCKNGSQIFYNKLCICTGASPKSIWYNENVITIRDTDSVNDFKNKLKSSKKVIIIGNGGIATELVYELKNVDLVWVVKNKHIGATFLDPGASEFFQESLINKISSNDTEGKDKETIFKRIRYEIDDDNNTNGPSLGPDWNKNLELLGASTDNNVEIEYSCEIERILESDDEQWKIKVILTNGKVYYCDMVISAIGVVPNSNILIKGNPFVLSEDSGISVNEFMKTSIPNIFAAGDVCTPIWELSKHWFQMRLWTQAYQMGTYASKCMFISHKNELTQNNEVILQDFCFELFTHMTKFFGYKIILLGLYNGQTLNNDYEILLRVTKGTEYIKIILQNGRMQGAILIGDTDIEEMCENLILNQTDLTDIADDLLNPNIDIEDYFD